MLCAALLASSAAGLRVTGSPRLLAASASGHRHGPALMSEPPKSLDRRAASLVFVASLSSFAIKPFLRELVPEDLELRWDAEAAKAAAKAGALCPAVSCADARFAEVQAALDTSSLESNTAGNAADYAPVVYVEPQFGMMSKAAVARYKVVAVSPLPKDSDDAVELMWLRDAATGRVVAVRGFDSEPPKNPLGQELPYWPYTLSASLTEPYAGVARGETLVPLVYYSKAGLWQGEPFVLCGPEQSSCAGPGLVNGVRVDTLNKYGATKTGASLLKASRPQLFE